MKEESKKPQQKPVEVLAGRFEHFASEEAKQQHLKQVAEAQRNGAPF